MDAILTKITEVTGLLVYPFVTDSLDDSIVYTYEPYTDDGIKKQDRLTIRLITKNIDTALTCSDAIKKALITVGDNESELGYLDCYQNGGGAYKDETTGYIHTILYFYITYRVR